MTLEQLAFPRVIQKHVIRTEAAWPFVSYHQRSHTLLSVINYCSQTGENQQVWGGGAKDYFKYNYVKEAHYLHFFAPCFGWAGVVWEGVRQGLPLAQAGLN